MVKFINAGFMWLLILGLNTAYASSELPAIPLQSHLVEVNGHQLHLHQKGQNTNKPLLILLSGPTDNWHSDSAWWTVAQNTLSQTYQTLAIDRAGQAWSERIDAPSYRQFAKDLSSLINDKDIIEAEREIVFVAFASSNLSLHLLFRHQDIAQRTQGIVLIDPDVLTPHSIEHYTAETEQYKTGWAGLEEYIHTGKYDQRIQQKLNHERQHLEQILTDNTEGFMDWDYYDSVEMIRQTRDYQIHKFLEVSVYKDDLEAAKKHTLPNDLPLVIVDTDFEAAYLERIEEEKVRASVAQWRKEGMEWYFQLAQASNCGAYWPVETQEHLLMMTQPDIIEQAIDKVLACSKSKK